MATMQWRPEVNALTTPPSYKILHVPRSISGYSEMAAEIAAANPNFTEEMIKSLGPLIMSWIQNQLINGNQVTLANAFTFSISFNGKLDSPDDPLPENDDLIQVNVRVSVPYMREIRHRGKLERLPMVIKQPLINATEDTKLKLADVLFADGALKLSGSNLNFDESKADCGCVLEGTAGGRKKQSTYALISKSTVLLVPDIPAQSQPWQNEYTVTLTTRYSENGTLRSGSSRRKLRSPLLVTGLGSPELEAGILTGGAAAAQYASIIDGVAAADERLRVQAVLDSRNSQLLLNLLDMRDGGEQGEAVTAAANSDYVLQGFSGSAVSSLTVRVSDYDALFDLVRSGYAGRLVDILDIRLT